MVQKKKDKEPVKLRGKKLSDGAESLYLDIYRNGKRRYEFLKLYVVQENTKEDKEKNKQTLQLANAIKAKRVVQLQNEEFGFATQKGMVQFLPFIEGLKTDYKPILHHIRKYEKDKGITLGEISREWVDGFHTYLNRQDLKENSKVTYFKMLKSIFRQAVAQGHIEKSPMSDGTVWFRSEDTTRNYLTLEEVKSMVQAECRNETVKRAFLFSCLTGLRNCDLRNLTYGMVQKQDGRTRLIFRQQKTRGQEYLDITEQAEAFLSKDGKGDDEKVFPNLPEDGTTPILAKWAEKAGIRKKITFHCARHTFAVMMISLGVDIYTVSKLLGHKSVSVTQIYAKVLDKGKQSAVDKIPNIFSD